MRVYHGSTSIIANPNVDFSRNNLDFGCGFYLTSFKDQAERWAKRKAVREASVTAIVSVYELKDELAGMRVLEFENNSQAWVEFVCDSRRGSEAYQSYDLIKGSVANDKVYAAVDMYYKKIWDIETTLQALKFYELNDQICLVSQKAIDELLTYVSFYEVSSC